MIREKEILRAYQSQKTKLGTQEHTFMMGAKWADSHPRWISVEDELPKENGRRYRIAGTQESELTRFASAGGCSH